MTDYGHDLLFGTFTTPTAANAENIVSLAQLADRAGLDLVTFQDHPYQPAFLDAWTLLSYVAARTERIHLVPNVLNLPLRQPVVIARSAASLDILSGGRVELGLGTGAFWDAIEASGGRRLTPGQGVSALAEAIEIVREIWAVDLPGGVHRPGDWYTVDGAKRGPAPVHSIGLWLGAYKPRMLRLTGSAADGWLPSLGYLKGGPSDLIELNAQIDAGAEGAGRDPRAVRRLLNIGGTFAPAARGLLNGPANRWAEDLAEISLEYGVSGYILAADDGATIQRYAEEVAPAVRELVAAERERRAQMTVTAGDVEMEEREREFVAAAAGELDGTGPADPKSAETSADAPAATAELAPGLGLVPTPDDGVRLSDERLFDEESRPLAPAPPTGVIYTDTGRAVGAHLIEVHDGLRQELAQVREIITQVRQGAMEVADARSTINDMTMRQNEWTLGAYCASYCRVVTGHHSLEDEAIFPHLRASDDGLAPVIDRLEDEHLIIHEVLEGVDAALVRFILQPDDFSELQEAVDILTDTLLSHLSYEERELIEPLARYGFYDNQV